MFTVKPRIHARQVESLSFINLLLAPDRQLDLQKEFSLAFTHYQKSNILFLHPLMYNPNENIAITYYTKC
jgi:hypothetical protein